MEAKRQCKGTQRNQRSIEIRKLEKKTDQVIKLLEKERKRQKERDKNIKTAIKNDKNKNKKTRNKNFWLRYGPCIDG